MNNIVTKLIATTILSAASLAAVAQTAPASEAARDAANMHAQDQYPIVSFKGTRTRADVKAELVAAQRAGTITNGDDYPIIKPAPSHQTRAEVKAELVAAQNSAAANSLYQGH